MRTEVRYARMVRRESLIELKVTHARSGFNRSQILYGPGQTEQAETADEDGGAMRLYEPGHPTIFDLSGNRWVSIMIAKHLLVVATTVCGVLATRESQPLARRRLLARLSLGFVLIIGLLGAMANVVGPQ